MVPPSPSSSAYDSDFDDESELDDGEQPGDDAETSPADPSDAEVVIEEDSIV